MRKEFRNTLHQRRSNEAGISKYIALENREICVFHFIALFHNMKERK
jgi:hypothetical protein